MSDETKIGIGSVVMLMSGGPSMTVVALRQDKETMYYACAWFSASGKIREGDFPEGTIQIDSDT